MSDDANNAGQSVTAIGRHFHRAAKTRGGATGAKMAQIGLAHWRELPLPESKVQAASIGQALGQDMQVLAGLRDRFRLRWGRARGIEA